MKEPRCVTVVTIAASALLAVGFCILADDGILTIRIIQNIGVSYAGVSENRGSYYSALNSRIRIIRTPNKVLLIFGNSHALNPQP